MEKLSWVDLRKAIAQRINTDEKEVGTFMAALAPAIIKALQEDRQVKITSFGTFKLQSIAPRKSVNVVTGEAFTLPGYDKLTFSPEAAVKELIGNLNSSPAPQIDESTPLKKLDAQATEIVGILSDLGQTPTSNVPEEEISETQPSLNREANDEEKPAEEPIKEEPIKSNYIMNEQELQREERVKKNRTWLVAGITVIGFTILVALVFLFLGNQFVDWVNGLNYDDEDEIEVVRPKYIAPTNHIVETPEITPESTPERTTESTLPYPLTYNEFIAQEYLPEGSRLAWLARKYYGDRDLWVFIYEANRNVVEHPSIIPVGTLIRVPKLPEEMMDFSNPELQDLVDRLADEYTRL